jgi:hypothetical protein
MSNPKGNANTLKPYKPKWKSGATHTIRVPIALTDELLVIAKKLDSDEPISIARPINIENAIEAVLSDSTVTRNGRDKGAIKRALNALQNRLQGI